MFNVYGVKVADVNEQLIVKAIADRLYSWRYDGKQDDPDRLNVKKCAEMALKVVREAKGL